MSHPCACRRVNILRIFSRPSSVILLFFLLHFLSPVGAHAEPGATSLEFLRIPQGARAVAMGGAYTAVVRDATSMYWNPAGLGFVRSSQVTFQNNQYIADISQNYLAMALPTYIGTWGFSANVLTIEDIERTTLTSGQAGQTLGFFGARDIAVDMGWGAEVMVGVSLGASARFITSRIYDEEGTTMTGDVGVQFKPLDRWTIGVALKNYGGDIRYNRVKEPLPRSLRVGTAFRFLSRQNLIVSMELNKVRYDDLFMNFGVEYTFFKHLSLRGGYSLEYKDVKEGLTGGIGVRVGFIDADYAFIPFGLFGDTHRFSLTFRFGSLMNKNP